MAGAPKHVVVAVLLALTLAFSPEHARAGGGGAGGAGSAGAGGGGAGGAGGAGAAGGAAGGAGSAAGTGVGAAAGASGSAASGGHGSAGGSLGGIGVGGGVGVGGGAHLSIPSGVVPNVNAGTVTPGAAPTGVGQPITVNPSPITPSALGNTVGNGVPNANVAGPGGSPAAGAGQPVSPSPIAPSVLGNTRGQWRSRRKRRGAARNADDGWRLRRQRAQCIRQYAVRERHGRQSSRAGRKREQCWYQRKCQPWRRFSRSRPCG